MDAAKVVPMVDKWDQPMVERMVVMWVGWMVATMAVLKVRS